jgi:hypothetical protein
VSGGGRSTEIGAAVHAAVVRHPNRSSSRKFRIDDAVEVVTRIDNNITAFRFAFGQYAFGRLQTLGEIIGGDKRVWICVDKKFVAGAVITASENAIVELALRCIATVQPVPVRAQIIRIIGSWDPE